MLDLSNSLNSLLISFSSLEEPLKSRGSYIAKRVIESDSKISSRIKRQLIHSLKAADIKGNREAHNKEYLNWRKDLMGFNHIVESLESEEQSLPYRDLLSRAGTFFTETDTFNDRKLFLITH